MRLPVAAAGLAAACLSLRLLPLPAPTADERLRHVQANLRQQPPHPLPTPGADEQKKARKEWMARMHRAAPGVDTQALDRSLGQAMTRRRAASLAKTPTGTWIERGSNNQAGRMHTAAWSTDGSTLVAGSALGGVWTKPIDDSSPWQPIGDGLYGGAHWLVLLPPDVQGDPDIVIAASDWGYVNRSVDGGQTWEECQLDGSPTEVRRLLRTSDAVFLVTGDSGSYRLQRSTDGGASFQTIAELGWFAGDVWTPRTGDGGLYLADDGILRVSDDLGDTWQDLGTYTEGLSTRIAGSEAGAPTLYVVVDNVELWRSDDGTSFVEASTVTDFWGELAASTIDPMVVAWGGMEFRYSTDGGETSSRINEWWEYYGREQDRLHADIMGIDVLPDDGTETWFISTDGGLFQSTDDLQTVDNLSLQGLRVSQYYGTLTHVDDPDFIAAGAQDQGYQLSTGVTADERQDFDQLISGDYAHLISGDGSFRFVFSVYPGFILVHLGEDGEQLGAIDYPDEEAGSYFAWLPPLVPDTKDPSAFFFCATHLYRYSFADGGWQPELWSDEDFGKNAYEFLSAMAFSPSDPARAYATTSIGRMFVSDDGGHTWQKSDDRGPDSHYFYGSALVVDPDDPDVAWVGGSGYGEPAVYRTTNGGQSWQDWGQGLPDTLIYDLAVASDGSGRVFAAGQTAAYIRDVDGEWEDLTGIDAPITTYWSVEPVPGETIMRFGTYGRGIWDYAYVARTPDPEYPDTDTPATPTDERGCGCASGGSTSGLLLLPALIALGRRRRLRPSRP